MGGGGGRGGGALFWSGGRRRGARFGEGGVRGGGGGEVKELHSCEQVQSWAKLRMMDWALSGLQLVFGGNKWSGRHAEYTTLAGETPMSQHLGKLLRGEWRTSCYRKDDYLERRWWGGRKIPGLVFNLKAKCFTLKQQKKKRKKVRACF